MRLSATFLAVLLTAAWATASPALELGARTGSGAQSGAGFSGGASAGSGSGLSSAFAEDQAFSATIGIDVEPAHAGRTGAIFVIATVDGALLQRLPNGSWVAWNGDFRSLAPTVGPRPLKARENVFVLASPGGVLAGRNVQLFVAYRAPDGDLHFNWPPVPVAVAGRCARKAGPGSLVVDAANAVLVAEVVYRVINALSDTSSLIDQTTRQAATAGPGTTPCSVAGRIAATVSRPGAAGRLDRGESIRPDFERCVLGGNVVVDGRATVTADTTAGSVDSGFGADWTYEATAAFDRLAHRRGSVEIVIDGSYRLSSGNFAATGIQTIDFDTPDLTAEFNGYPLALTSLCHESNAFGASRKQSESFGLRLDAGAVGDLVVNARMPVSGSFGGPSTGGRIEALGANGSAVTLDLGQCGNGRLAISGRGPGGSPIAVQPRCVPIGAFQD